MSTAPPIAEREGPAESVAGFLAALAIFGGLISIAQRPVTIGLSSLFVALAAAVAIAATSWLVGMIVCVLTNRPLW